MSDYDYNERIRRRRQYRARQRRRRRQNLLLLAVAVLLVGALVLCLSMCGREEEVPPDDDQSGEVMSGSSTTQIPVDPKDEWNLILVNDQNPIPEGYTMELTALPNGLEVDKRCYADLTAMLDAVRAQRMTPVVCSAYRSRDMQQEIYNDMVDSYVGRGYARVEAERLAAKEVALPGTSEHHLGLAVDIVDWDYQLLDKGQEDTAVQQWLMANSWRYGFILRYPTDKTDVTGIIYEPWHYRYVGKERAKEIYDSGLCFEEWLEIP